MSSITIHLEESYPSAICTYSSCLFSASPIYFLFPFPHLLIRVVEVDADILPELVELDAHHSHVAMDHSEVAVTEEASSETSAKMAMSSAGTVELQVVGHETCAVLTILKLDVEPATEAVPCEGATDASAGGAVGTKSIIHMSGTTYNLDE